MVQNKINEQGQDLPEAFYVLIGKFALTFSKLSGSQQQQAKQQLAHSIVISYSEYKDVIIDNYAIPFINDKEFKQLYSDAESDLLKNANELIDKYKLKEYRDIIIDNYSLSVSALINIAEYCYQQKKCINESCRLYCVLGYAKFDYRYGNEGYLIGCSV